MSKNIVIVSSSPRAKSNSDVLAQEFCRGAKESGHTVRTIRLRELDLKFCIGCMACHDLGKCVIKDSVNELLPVVADADVLVFATPIYYYEMCGQLKTFLDRMNPLYGRDNRFREVYVLATAADGSEEAFDNAFHGVQGWIDCFDGVKLIGTVRGGGLTDSGEAEGSLAARQAYQLGLGV